MAGRSQQGDVARIEAGSSGDEEIALLNVLATPPYVRAGLDMRGADAARRYPAAFLRRHPVCTGGQHGAGHDTTGGTRGKRRRRLASANRSGQRCDIGNRRPCERVSVDRRLIEGRKSFARPQVACEKLARDVGHRQMHDSRSLRHCAAHEVGHILN